MTDTANEAPGPIDNSAMQPDIAAQRAAESTPAKPAAPKAPQDAAPKPPASTSDNGADEQNDPEGSAASESGDATATTRKGVGKRIDELTGNWRAEQRAREAAERERDELRQRLEAREQAKSNANDDDAQPPPKLEFDPNRRPSLEDFNFDAEAHAEAVADWVVEKRERAREEAESRREKLDAAATRRAAFEAENPDYAEVVSDPNLPITKDMAEAMFDTDQPEAIAYYLGKNPAEAAQISQLSPRQQVIAIGRLEAKLAAPAAPAADPATAPTPAVPPKPVPVSKAPAPVTTLGTGSSVAKRPDEMSMEEYDAMRTRQEQAARGQR